MKIFAIIRRSIVIFLLVALIVTWAILKTNANIAEGITQTVAKGYNKGVTFLSGLAPHVSLTEILFLIIIIVSIILLVFAIKNLIKLRITRAICKVLDIAIIVLFVAGAYSISCEAAYNRKKMPLPYYQNKVLHDDFVPIYNYFANDINDCVANLTFEENGDVKSMKLEEITKEVKKSYSIVTDPYFYSHFGNVKPMLSSFLYREFQITGVSFNALGEANVNTLDTHVDLPFTVAHELAHTKGVMRENDANQLAFYVCLNSENPHLRYAAYVGYFYQMEIIASYLTDEEKTTLVTIDPHFYKTRSYVSNYWKKHNMLEKVGDFFNNLYIKSSGVKEGTESYYGGTNDYEYDNVVMELTPSTYQSLFLEKYYR